MGSFLGKRRILVTGELGQHNQELTTAAARGRRGKEKTEKKLAKSAEKKSKL